jgi:hypothetical protein
VEARTQQSNLLAQTYYEFYFRWKLYELKKGSNYQEPYYFWLKVR